MKLVLLSAVLSFGFAASLSTVSGEGLPVIRSQGSAQQLIVNGKPFLILGGELGNSSAGTAAQADVILPKLDGRELALRVTRSHPSTRILFISGYPEGMTTPDGFLESGCHLLEKPFTAQSLLSRIREVLGR